MSLPFLPYGKQWIDEQDIAAVTKVLQSDFLTTGPETEAFEKDLAAACGAKFAVAVANGTAAETGGLLADGRAARRYRGRAGAGDANRSAASQVSAASKVNHLFVRELSNRRQMRTPLWLAHSLTLQEL